MLFGLFKRRYNDPMEALYRSLVERARNPVLYRDYAVPDTVEGRFETVVLYCGLVVTRLGHGTTAADPGRRLVEAFFSDMDRTLREMGTGDLTVPKKMKRIASAFYGRMGAYEAGMKAPEEPGTGLAAAIARNIYDDAAPAGMAEALARHAQAVAAALEAATREAVIADDLAWPDPADHAPRSGAAPETAA